MSEPEHMDSGAAEHGDPGNTEASLAPGGGGVTAEVLQLRLADPDVSGHVIRMSDVRLLTEDGPWACCR